MRTVRDDGTPDSWHACSLARFPFLRFLCKGLSNSVRASDPRVGSRSSRPFCCPQHTGAGAFHLDLRVAPHRAELKPRESSIRTRFRDSYGRFRRKLVVCRWALVPFYLAGAGTESSFSNRAVAGREIFPIVDCRAVPTFGCGAPARKSHRAHGADAQKTDGGDRP